MDLNDIAVRLETKFGLGDKPEQSRYVYRLVERLCHGPHADQVYRIVAGLAEDIQANPKNRDKGKVFRAVVVRELKAAGYWPQRTP